MVFLQVSVVLGFLCFLQPGESVELLKKARCVIPNGASHVTRTLLLQQCISSNAAQGNETKCYEGLGCFPMDEPWTSVLRPLPSPLHPQEVDVKLTLFTRDAPGRPITLWPDISLQGMDLGKKRTVFITHGFASDGNASWLHHMKDAYLRQEDANVIIVDWGRGASKLNYLQVASNTRIVGAELTRLGRHLLGAGLRCDSLHLIGHSLGAHISSYTAKGIRDLCLPARLTALDPAQPGFEGTDKRVRLHKEDAQFIDVVHTDATPFIPFIGFGMMQPVGHNDYYINGGAHQPGCVTDIDVNITSIQDLARVPVEVVSKWVSCSHGRAYEVFTASIDPNTNCSFWGRKMPLVESIMKLGTLGKLSLVDPLVSKLEECKADSCSLLGLPALLLRARGAFAVTTGSRPPFCLSNSEVDKKLQGLVQGLQGVGDKTVHLADTLASKVSNINPFGR